MPDTKSIYILHGFCEGPYMSRNLRKHLKKSGYTISKKLHEANIIFAHSGGCLLVPKNHNADLVIYCGYPYWPGKSNLKAILQNTMTDLRVHLNDGIAPKWLYKTVWNGIYFWKIKRNLAMLKNISKVPKMDPSSYHILIRNRFDKGLVPEFEKLPDNLSQAYVSVRTGSHEDCWYSPETYAELINAVNG